MSNYIRCLWTTIIITLKVRSLTWSFDFLPYSFFKAQENTDRCCLETEPVVPNIHFIKWSPTSTQASFTNNPHEAGEQETCNVWSQKSLERPSASGSRNRLCLWQEGYTPFSPLPLFSSIFLSLLFKIPDSLSYLQCKSLQVYKSWQERCWLMYIRKVLPRTH